MLYLGTSGFSFDDWRGTVYPENIPKSKMLDYYWKILGFNSVELNFTYYSLPSRKTTLSFVKRTPPDFVFAAKLPSHVTHEGWKRGLDTEIVESYLESMEPLIESGKLKMHLVQFPTSFRYNPQNIEYIERIYGLVSPLAVEFRHDSWNREDVYERLEDLGITYVVVDEPRIDHLFPYVPRFTSNIGYFRFHGRNERWFEVSGGERYDYHYSDEELSTFTRDVSTALKTLGDVFAFFNNCHRGNAAINAKRFREMIG